jgi:uncharacterized membrane protein YebE (DUF533 family)
VNSTGVSTVGALPAGQTVLDTANGRKLWGQKIGGAIGGGVITYSVNGHKKSPLRKVSRKFCGQPKSQPPRYQYLD